MFLNIDMMHYTKKIQEDDVRLVANWLRAIQDFDEDISCIDITKSGISPYILKRILENNYGYKLFKHHDDNTMTFIKLDEGSYRLKELCVFGDYFYGFLYIMGGIRNNIQRDMANLPIIYDYSNLCEHS